MSKYHVKVIQWNKILLAEYHLNTLEQVKQVLKEDFKRNLGYKKHFKDNCFVSIHKLKDSFIQKIKEGLYIPLRNLEYENFKYKEYGSLNFKNSL